MPGTSPRTRLIFQNSNLFVSPPGISGNGATGTFSPNTPGYGSGQIGGITGGLANGGSPFIQELSRVQSIDLSVGLDRLDINQFGQLNRIDSQVLTPPTIGLNFSYYLTDGANENKLGFAAKGGASFVSGFITNVSNDKNYFISYSPQGIDDDGFGLSEPSVNQRDVIGIGNGYITNYSINAAVAQPVTATVAVEGLNVAFYTGCSGKTSPAVFPSNSVRVTGWRFALPTGTPQTEVGSLSILKPGDISLSIPQSAGFGSAITGPYGANIQSFTLTVPITRQRIQKLGSPFGISNEIQFPVNCTLSIQALQTDLQENGLDTLLCSDAPKNISIQIRKPDCAATGAAALNLTFNSAFMTNYAISQTIGGDATLTIDLTSQLAGAFSTDGFTFSGYNGSF